jgi:hypothetical protein
MIHFLNFLIRSRINGSIQGMKGRYGLLGGGAKRSNPETQCQLDVYL